MGDSALGDVMYLTHFGLREPPFSITPDPRFLYMSARHREALAHLIYGVGEHGGFVQLTGEVGTGKTSVCRLLLEQLPVNVDLALVFNPRLSPVELLATVCDELRIAYPAGTTSAKDLVDRLHRHLLEAHTAGRRTVLIVDEAQNLAPEVLEEVRLLTNLETARDKLLQVILIGQPELAAILEQPKLRQLAQRVTARYHLEPLSRQETAAYIRHRLAVAGRGRAVFTAGALRSLYRRSRGIPRIINAMADRALLGAYTRESSQVDAATVRRAAAEVLGQAPAPWRRWLRGAVVAALVVALSALGLVLLAPGEIGRSEVGRESSASSGFSPSLTGGLSMPTSVPSQSAAGLRLADVLRDPGVPATKGDALAVLQGLWGVPAAGSLLDCERPAPGALECLAAVGTWQKLRRLDLPAALELAAPGGERRYGVLTALTPSEATLRFGDRVVTALLAEVEPFWNGGFVLLWRPPTADVPVRRGARESAPDWLLQPTARVPGEPGPAGRLYDQSRWERVALHANAVVGYETAFLGAAEREPEAPRLGGLR
jgi:general secretion pathway protein A